MWIFWVDFSRYAPETPTSVGNKGEYIFTISSRTDFDTIVFLGANYGGGYNPANCTNPTDVSDYLVRQVGLLDGDELTATPNPDRFDYQHIADGGDYISGFNPSQDAIVISKAGFGLNTVPLFDTILGTTPISQVRNRFKYTISGGVGVLSFDRDGLGNPLNKNTDVVLATLQGAPALTNLFFDS